jgi:hypothetical protein
MSILGIWSCFIIDQYTNGMKCLILSLDEYQYLMIQKSLYFHDINN